MALPAKVYWAKLQKELKGQSEHEQIATLRRYVAEWPGWDDIQYRKMRDQAEKMLRKLETNEATKSSKGQQDPFHVKRQGDGQMCLIGAVNSGKSALISTLTAAHIDVADYPFTTQRPAPGMLEHDGAALQLIDTPALVPGTSGGEGSGRRLLHLYSTADAAAFAVDLSHDPLAQMSMMQTELAAAGIMLLPHPVCTEFHAKSKGGIRFTGIPIAKEAQADARRILASHNVPHAEIRIRESFSSDELTAQVEHRPLLPSIIIANKNDTPEAEQHVTALWKAYPDYRMIDVNFLDEVHFDRLKKQIFYILGLMHVNILERPLEDAPIVNRLVLLRTSTLSDVLERLSLSNRDQVKVANIWGNSVKYSGQEVGLDHLVEDGDKIWIRQ
jgi:ribosome-interacting GTPase 1